ncbi:uncharacterized protein LOC144172905 [Haemaphysalis longicornis]
MASVSMKFSLLVLLATLLAMNQACGQITFSKNWQPGKRSEMCSQKEAQAIIKLRHFLLEEAKRLEECRLFYSNEANSED